MRVVTGGHAQIDEVHSGGSVMSQSDLRLHFGLGRANVVDEIEVRWPTTRRVETFAGVRANQILTIREGSGIVDRRGPAGDRRAGSSTALARPSPPSAATRDRAPAEAHFWIASSSWRAIATFSVSAGARLRYFSRFAIASGTLPWPTISAPRRK